MGKMAEVQRRLLEQMMGPEAMGIQPLNVDWWSEKVCRDFLFGTCPHMIFGNTKMDIGPCPRLHSDRILKQFQESQAAHPDDTRISSFKQQHENSLYRFIEECDRRIRNSQRKLEKTPEENKKTVDLMREIGEIELSIQGGTEEIEALGEAGKVEESMEKLAAVDALKNLKTEKEQELIKLNENAGASGHQKLRVCETCGAMLSVLDSDKRLADHFGGKMHLGYHMIRELLAKFAEERMAARNAPPPPPPVRSQPPPTAPSGPSSHHPNTNNNHAPPPHTPSHPRIPPADEMPTIGHGDKVKREAGELVDDIKDVREKESQGRDRERGEKREREGYSETRSSRGGEKEEKSHRDRDRGDRYGDRDEKERYDKYEKHDREKREERSSRYEDRDRRDRDRDRDRKYEDDRSTRHRSRSPAKRRVV